MKFWVSQRGSQELDLSNILFFTPDAFFDYLSTTIVQSQQPTETTMKGYRINVAYDAVSHSEMHNKKSAIANVILNSMKKKK